MSVLQKQYRAMNIYLADGGSQLKVVYQQNNDAFQNIRVLQYSAINDFNHKESQKL